MCGLNVGQNFAKQESRSPYAQAWGSWNACMVVCIRGFFCGENYVKYNKDVKTGEHVLMSSCPHTSFYFCNPRHWNPCNVLLLFWAKSNDRKCHHAKFPRQQFILEKSILASIVACLFIRWYSPHNQKSNLPNWYKQSICISSYYFWSFYQIIFLSIESKSNLSKDKSYLHLQKVKGYIYLHLISLSLTSLIFFS